MAIYAIGDIQGCYASFRALLKKLNFDPQQDKLWLAGDLVNRGGQSLKTLEYIYSIKDSVITVLGNHDLHLIAAFHGKKKLKPSSDLNEILNSPNASKLINWLEQQPLLHSQYGYTMVHAGIHPKWSLKQAKRYAKEVEKVLASDKKLDFLAHMYGEKPKQWKKHHSGNKRLRCITNIFTRMRFLDSKSGALNFSQKGHPDHTSKKFTPWYNYPRKVKYAEKIIIGHWAALNGESKKKRIIALDTGCVWGGYLTAYNIKTGKRTRQARIFDYI